MKRNQTNYKENWLIKIKIDLLNNQQLINQAKEEFSLELHQDLARVEELMGTFQKVKNQNSMLKKLSTRRNDL